MASTDDYYNFKWLSIDKKIHVLQNKFFSKKSSLFFNAGLGQNSTSDFQITSSKHFNLGYFFSEQWGVEGYYHLYTNENNDSFKKASASGLSLPFIRRMTAAQGFSVLYSPFYGKVNTFNKVFYFEFIFGAGLGSFSSENNRTSFENSDPRNTYETESLTDYHYKIQFRINVTKHFLLNLDYYKYMYKAFDRTGEEQEQKSTSDVFFSLGYTI